MSCMICHRWQCRCLPGIAHPPLMQQEPEEPEVHVSTGGKDPNAKIYSAKDVEHMISVALLTRESEDTKRLDFMIANDAFFTVGKGDAGNTIYMLLTQDEDEGMHELSSWRMSEREAIDDAIKRKKT